MVPPSPAHPSEALSSRAAPPPFARVEAGEEEVLATRIYAPADTG